MSFLGSLFRRSSLANAPSGSGSESVEEGLDLALSFLESGAEVDHNLGSPSINIIPPTVSTPTSKPENSSIPRKITSSLRKVTFDSIKENNVYYSSSPSRVLSPLRPLPPSEEKPPKSILKPFKPSALSTVTRKPFASFQEMLDSIVKQLAAGDERNKIDAYQAFLSAIQAKISVPDQDALLDATPSLLEFIYRDVQNPSTQNLQIATWALKFLATLTRMIPVSEQPEYDGLSNLLNLSLITIEKEEAPKVIVQHHLLFLGQKLHIKIMTSERAARVLVCLSRIHERVQGNVVKVYRLVIYQQFMENIANVMLSRADDWLPTLFNCLLSNKAEVRRHALNLGMTASLRHAKLLTKNVYDMLLSKNEENSFNDLFVKKLESLLDHKDREMALMVPRVWAIIMFFLRPRFNDPDFWAWYRPWLSLLSRGMNSSDRQVKVEAFTAWKRCIYAVMPDRATQENVRRMLRHPFVDGLPNQKELQQGLGRSMMSGYLCLLYYSLRPTTTFDCLDLYWDDYVIAVLNLFVLKKSNGQHLYCSASILQALFQSTEKWNEERANSIQPFEIDELCRLDPTWIRSRLSKVLAVVQPVMLQSHSWAPIDDEKPDAEETAYTNNLALSTWSALMEAVKEAGSKEITVSTGLKLSIASVMNTLFKVGNWLQKNPPPSIPSARAFQLLTDCAISRLGPANFTEKILSRNPESEDFEIAPTPSHRAKAGKMKSAITQLLNMQIDLVSEDLSHLEAFEMVVSMITQCFRAMSARTSKLNLLADLLESLDQRFGQEEVSQLAQDVADHLMGLAEELTRPVLSGLTITSLNSKDFDAILSLNRHFISVRGSAPKVLYEHAVDAAKRTNGAGGLLLAVTEPHAAIIHQFMTADDGTKYSLLLSCANMVISHDVRPRNWGAVERGRKSLYGGVSPMNGTAKAPDLEFTNLSSLANYALRYGYAQLRPAGDAQIYANVIKVLIDYLNRVPPVSYAVFLRHIQAGVCCVLEDSDFHIRDYVEDRGKETLVKEILSFWQNILAHAGGQGVTCLQSYEDILLAGLTSPRATIVNHTITFWNTLLERNDEQIDCPDSILDTIKQLSRIATVRLPAGVEVEEDATTNPVTSYFDYSQRSMEPSQRSHPPSSIARKLHKPSPQPQQISNGKISKRQETPRRKLRHEDSQIHFEVIESSPITQETQHLTEHQKEVAERQYSDATMFPDIRSNSQQEAHRIEPGNEIPVQELDSELSNQSDDMVGSSDQEEPQSSPPTSPTFCPNHVQSDDQDPPQSSPVVASVKRKRNHSVRSGSKTTAVPVHALVEDGSAFDLPSSPPSVIRRQFHDLMNSHLTEESDVINSTKANTQMEDVPQSNPTKSKKSLIDRLREAPERISTSSTTSSDPALREAQLQGEMHPKLVDSQATQTTVISVEVPRSETEDGQGQHDIQQMDASAVEDSFVPHDYRQHDLADEQATQISLIPSLLVDTAVTPVPDIQDAVSDSQASQRSTTSFRSSTRLRRRKAPFSVVEEAINDDEAQPSQKRRKASGPASKRGNESLVASSPQNIEQSPREVAMTSAVDSLVVVDSFAEANNDVVVIDALSSPARGLERGIATPKSILERLRDLVAEASSTRGWSSDDQKDIAELAFELQAISRGR